MTPVARTLLAGILLGGILVSPAVAEPLVAFITSVKGTGDLSTWADAGGETGIDAGDTICQARAAAAGLTLPLKFVAWLSDSSDDAYCRIHGLTGKKADKCGEDALPAYAGPWLRTDGYPFGGIIEELLNGLVLTTLSMDEYGNPTTEGTVFTASAGGGQISSSSPVPCNDWTLSSSDSVGIGGARLTGNRWSSNGTGACHIAKPLYCLQSGIGDPLPSLPMEGALAFVTSTTGKGRLQDWAEAGGETGVDAGDAICQARASAAGYANPSHFLAWLSDDQEHAADRFTYDGPWIRPDGMPVASSLADLTDGTLFAPLNRREDGYYNSAQWAWTGSSEDGLYTSQDCDHWASDSDTFNGTRGFTIAAKDYWTDSGWDEPCDGTRALYCFSQVPIAYVFADGFESGTMDEWDG